MPRVNILLEYIICIFVILYYFLATKVSVNRAVGIDEDSSRNIYFTILLFFAILYIFLNLRKMLKLFLYQKKEIIFFFFFIFYNILVTTFHYIDSNNINILSFAIFRQISFPIMFLCFYQISYFRNNFKTYIKIILFGIFSLYIYNNLTIKDLKGDEVFRSPGAMYFVILFPLSFFVAKNMVKELLYLLALLIVAFLSLNRGITLSVFLICILYALFRFKKTNIKIFIIIFLSFAFYFFLISGVGETLMNRFSKIPDDGGSGRISIWFDYINLIVRSGINNFFFGHGFRLITTKIGIGAHNDFINFLTYFGFFSFLMYLTLHFIIIKNIITNKYKNKLFFSILFFYIIFLINSMIIDFFEVYSQFLGIYLGVYFGIYYKVFKNENLINNSKNNYFN
jgi:hypothetical protein